MPINQGFWTDGLQGTTDRMNSTLMQYNTLTNRPSAGQTGRVFFSTDTFELFRDNGSTWDLVSAASAALLGANRFLYTINWNSIDNLAIETAGSPTQTYTGAIATWDVNGNVDEYVNMRTNHLTGPALDTDWELTVRTNMMFSPAAGVTSFFGVMEGPSTGLLPVGASHHFAGIRCNSTNVRAVNGNASAETETVLTGLTGSHSQGHTVRIRRDGSTLYFYVNATLKATHTNNLPSGGNADIYIILDSDGTGSGTSSPRIIGNIIFEEID